MIEKEVISDYIEEAHRLVETGSVIKMTLESETTKYFLFISRQLFEFMYRKMRIRAPVVEWIEEENNEPPDGMIT